jgi:hypothetical protein
VLKSSLAELELMMLKAEPAGAYEPGDEYQFYRDLKTIVGFANSDLSSLTTTSIVSFLMCTWKNVTPSVAVRVLTNQVPVPLRVVAEKCPKKANFELRSSKDVLDRVVFSGVGSSASL